MLSGKLPTNPHKIQQSPEEQDQDQVTRSVKKPKRKITNWIFDHDSRQDEDMTEANVGSQPFIVPSSEKPSSKNGDQGNPHTQLFFRDMLRNNSKEGENPNMIFNSEDEDDEVSNDDKSPKEILGNEICPVILLTRGEKG